MTTPLVSVNMCTIRPVPRWRLMLDSMEQQTFKDFEYIVVDGLYDKRKDEMQKLFRDYSFPIVYLKDKPWFHSEEEKLGTRPGLSSARNTGVIHARGELMAWHDDNTWLPPDWLSRHVQAFNLGFDGTAGLAHGTYTPGSLEKYLAERYPSYVFEKKKIEGDRCGSCQTLDQPCTHMEELGDVKLMKDYRGDYDGNQFAIVDKSTGKIIETYNVLPLGWLYGSNMSIRTEYLLKINGFPEEFCGQMGSEDCFTTVCLQRAGAKLLLDKKSIVIHISDEHHLGFNEMFNFQNKELMLKDGKMHFSNEKFMEDLLFKEVNRYQNNPQFNLRELREEKLAELYSG